MIRTISTFLLSVTIASRACAQLTTDSVSLGAGYANQTFYSLENGELSSVDNSNWDIGFSVSGLGYGIRINGASGTELFKYPGGDTSAWNSVDTTGMASWSGLNNSDTAWNTGAFNIKEEGFNVGWGQYNVITHQIFGDSIFVIALADGSYKKLWIESLVGGVFSFRYADLDGSNEVSATLDKADFDGKVLGYYSLQDDQEVDREPADAWDMVFTKYSGEIAPGVVYGVTGVLTNNGVSVAQVSNVGDIEGYNDHGFHSFSSHINVIGYDWKSFNMGTFQFDIEDSLLYFVEEEDGDIWKLVMTGFVGSSSGDVTFQKEKIFAVGDEENIKAQYAVYPNPATDELYVILPSQASSKDVMMTNLQGSVVYSANLVGNGFEAHTIDVSNFEAGIYLLMVGELEARKVVVR